MRPRNALVGRRSDAQAHYCDRVTWSAYVARTCGDDQGKDFQAKTGIDGSTLSRWKRGDTGGGLRVDKVAAFARGYKVPVLEAFVEAGFLTAKEAKSRPVGRPDLGAITNDELVELVRQRLVKAGGEHGLRSAPIDLNWGPALVIKRPEGLNPMIVKIHGVGGVGTTWHTAGSGKTANLLALIAQQLPTGYQVEPGDEHVEESAIPMTFDELIDTIRAEVEAGSMVEDLAARTTTE